MSLVAYETSSDEGSENEDFVVSKESGIESNKAVAITNIKISSNSPKLSKESDDPFSTSKSKEKEENLTTAIFNKLPEPKPINSLNIEEEDDEFLHKKAIPTFVEKRPKKGPVQITIPSLSEFKDLDEKNDKSKLEFTQNPKNIRSCGLLSLLPKPKQEIFNKTIQTSSIPTANHQSLPISRNSNSNSAKLIPDSVKNRTQSKTKPLNPTAKKTQKSIETEINNNSDESDENEDFFSLNVADNKLPEVSLNEINAMVAKKAAKMAEVSSKLNESLNLSATEETDIIQSHNGIPSSSFSEQIDIDEKALNVLVGSRAKRRKMEEVNVVELSSAEVLPNKDEWLRTALASSTQYQPKGVLVDEEPAPGTRRKHQITYLAHQAKANEMELQAMWAANRHSRRQTQSKYGF